MTVTCARWVEAVLVGLGCALGLCAIAIHEDADGAALRAAALTGFAAAALAWGRANRPAPAQLAARIDSALCMDGAFVTAWQVESRAAGSNSMLALLVRQTVDGLRWRDVRRAVLPPSLACVALPFAGAALLAGALQEAHEELPTGGWEQSLAKELVHDLAQARDAAYASPGMADETQESMAQLVADARLMSAGAQAGPQALPDQERLNRLAEDLARVAPMTQADARVDGALERAASALAALQAAAKADAEAGRAEPRGLAGEPLDQEGGKTTAKNAPAGADPADQSTTGRAQGGGVADAQVAADSGSEGAGSSGTPKGAQQPLGADTEPDWEAGTLDASPTRALGGLDYLELLPSHRRALARRWIELQASGR